MIGGNLWNLIPTLTFIASPIIVVMLMDLFRKDWRSWRYYLLAFALSVVVDVLIMAIAYTKFIPR